MVKLSIIVPVYNTEKYLPRCLESLHKQDYHDAEFILIDDGSKDNSWEIMQHYAKLDARFVCVHQENQGVSAARNAGLKLAKGEWIGFVDSDDWIEINAYSRLLKAVDEHKADAVMFAYCVDYTNGKEINHADDTILHIGLIENFSAMENIYKVAPFCWTKLYKKSIIYNLRFRTDIYRGEDTIFLVEAFHNAKRIYSTREIFYHYVQSEGSATRGKVSARQLTGVIALKYLLDFADKYYPVLHIIALNNYVNNMVERYLEMFQDNFVDVYYNKIILLETHKYLKEVICSSHISRHQRMKLLLFYISPWLFCQILSRTRK